MKRNTFVGAFGAVVLTLMACGPDMAQAEMSPQAQVAAMKRGVNILGYDPLWKDPAKARFQPRLMSVIREGGFNTVRVNLHAFQHMDKDNRLSPFYFSTLDTMVDAANKAGLHVILDLHNFNECAEDVKACRPKIMAFWTQMAEHYKDAPDTVMFEILNEPHGPVNAVWNDMIAENLKIIRKTNPRRNVIVGPTSWNNLNDLEGLRLPADDPHLIVTFHYYEPFVFTHQGAAWTPDFKDVKGVAWTKAEGQARLDADFDKVKAWSARTGRPILLGEFGAYDKGPLDSRVAYTDAVARAAEARNWAWAYWQFDSDFIVYDIPADRWVKPIHGALIPEQAAKVETAQTPQVDPNDVMAHVINTPKLSSWNAYGAPQNATPVQTAEGAPIRSALRIPLSAAQPNAWDVGAVAQIAQPVKAGDKLQAWVWARAATPDAATRVPLNILISLNKAPWTALTNTPVQISSEWDMYVVQAVADKDYEAGTLMLALQLGKSAYPIELGAPVVLRNYAPTAQ
ncbi:MAG: glycoside hydrolase family 5 protein [Asticcacaulis sp.]|uniref:glycoside hydrolase family 5 protein n=1 Tax=Asticcacaulis sp. TaxID=1872648 RepID=UPI0025B9AE05|nr:glycoside hydrolase family 5 protein [Asticcacaulis sp.]MCA1936855.1 glycoside hydrolase family 5 protein [Asticcacaulis sp.]